MKKKMMAMTIAVSIVAASYAQDATVSDLQKAAGKEVKSVDSLNGWKRTEVSY